MKILLFMIPILLVSCGRKDKRPKDLYPSIALRIRYAEILTEAKEKFDHDTGWPSSTDCDGTLWAGLAVVSGVGSVQIGRAEYSSGEIHRRPAPSCWYDGEDHGSRSTVSRDMLTGYMWAMWVKGDREALERLADYGERHQWKMGEPEADGRTRLTANGYGLIARMIKNLGGATKVYILAPSLFFSNGADYEKHLNLIGILQNGQVDGAISSHSKEVLRDLYNDSPNDALFCAAQALYISGDAAPCEALLLGDYSYPSYIRGDANYRYVHWLLAAKVLIGL